MIWQWFYALPPLASVVWALFKMKGPRATGRKMVLAAIVVLLIIYFSIQFQIGVTGRYPSVIDRLVHDTAATLILPLTHLFVCYSVGITRALKVLKLLFALSLLLLPEYTTWIMSDVTDEMLAADFAFSFLRISFSPTFYVKLSVYSLIIFLQLAIEANRLYVLRKIFMVRDLYLSHGAKAVVGIGVFILAWVFITLLPSNEFYHNPIFNNLMVGSYSLLMTALTVALVRFFDHDIVRDREANAVNIEKDVDSEIAEAITVALERDKVYLNPNLRLDELAGMLMTNRTYLARAFRLKFEGSFSEVINHYRVEHAKRVMMEDKKKKMEEVASESGFSSANFFGRVFKQLEGVTPSQWRSGERAETPSPRKVQTARAAEARQRRTVLPAEGMTTDDALGITHRSFDEEAPTRSAAGGGAEKITPPRRPISRH